MKEAFKQLFYLIRHIDDVIIELLEIAEDKLKNAVDDRED